MRSALFFFGTVVLTTTVIGNAYYQKKQFYPSVIYITKSNPSMAILYLQAFVAVILTGKLMRKVFFGQLRAAELEHLIERSWYAVTETCLAFTVFRDDFSPKFVALFTLLLFLKSFHWLADDRVDYMERSPLISVLFHVRVLSLLVVLGSLDLHFVYSAYQSMLSKEASVQLVFGFEYAILFTIVLNISVKYLLHAVDLQRDSPWEAKAVLLLYTELAIGLIKVVLYILFMGIMIRIHTFPLFAIRPMYLTMRAFKKAFNDVILSRRAINNMNTLYADATAEELSQADNVCIICREEMTSSAKKLPCNHIFHTACLRSWFQRQQTCPTCRMDVLRVPSTTSSQQARRPAQPNGAQPEGPPVDAPNNNNNPFMYPNFPNFAANFIPNYAEWPPRQPRVQPSGDGVGVNNSATDSSTTNPTAQPQSSGAFFAGVAPPPFFNPFMRPPNGVPGGVPFPPPPMMFPFMQFPIPPPQPPPNMTTNLTEAELREMEGQERQHIEARLRCLRNVHTLLDAAVIQLGQYATIVSNLPEPLVTDGSGAVSTGSGLAMSSDTASSSDVSAAPVHTAVRASEPCLSTKVIPSLSPLEAASHSASPDRTEDFNEQLRRRRLEKLLTNNAENGESDSKTQPPNN